MTESLFKPVTPDEVQSELVDSLARHYPVAASLVAGVARKAGDYCPLVLARETTGFHPEFRMILSLPTDVEHGPICVYTNSNLGLYPWDKFGTSGRSHRETTIVAVRSSLDFMLEHILADNPGNLIDYFEREAKRAKLIGIDSRTEAGTQLGGVSVRDLLKNGQLFSLPSLSLIVGQEHQVAISYINDAIEQVVKPARV